MSEPDVVVGFESDQRVFRPGEILSGHYRVDGVDPAQLTALELSVLWHTAGKGDEDLAVHLFQRFLADEAGRLDGREAGWFSTQLPPSPLSYDGRIVKIHWCVRVRLFLAGGREIVREEAFQLGETQPVAVGKPATNGQSTSDGQPAPTLTSGAPAALPKEAAEKSNGIEDSREVDFSASQTVVPPTENT
jgi:hypothetical protein